MLYILQQLKIKNMKDNKKELVDFPEEFSYELMKEINKGIKEELDRGLAMGVPYTVARGNNIVTIHPNNLIEVIGKYDNKEWLKEYCMYNGIEMTYKELMNEIQKISKKTKEGKYEIKLSDLKKIGK